MYYKGAMLEPAQALKRILESAARTARLGSERKLLSECVGRALAEDVRADRPLPGFDNSQMDGYAVRAADVTQAGARLPVAFEVFAGDAADRALPKGACARIFTGAPMPAGADAVEMQEEVDRRGRFAHFKAPGTRGRFVRRAGATSQPGSSRCPRNPARRRGHRVLRGTRPSELTCDQAGVASSQRDKIPRTITAAPGNSRSKARESPAVSSGAGPPPSMGEKLGRFKPHC